MRVMSRLPLAVRISEPHPNPERPGDSPVLKQAILSPGINEVDGDLFKAWSGVGGASFLASSDDIKAGLTDGRVYEMTEDEAEVEYGFEPALKRAAEAGASEASKGAIITDPGLVKADDMRTGTSDAPTAPVLTASAPLKVPVTTEAAPAVVSTPAPAAKTAPAPAPAK